MTDDEKSAFVRALLDREDRPPRDVVPPGPGPSRETLLAMNDAVGTVVEQVIPGEVLVDLDGVPVAVEPSRTETSVFGGATVTRADLDRAGLTEADVPCLTVYRPKEKK